MIGDRIRDLRNQKRLSQTDLAKIINVSQQTVTKWETGKSEPSSSAINRLADYFDVSSDYLLGRKTPKPKMTVDEAMDTIMSADGKEPTEHDRKIMESIIKAYLDNRD
ncbi:helix-turn-helix domain-containing protein [Limosilactobacillus mucosae]|nr:helix-turn-helix transcriptional regulator [Limosilactobacillus mucosae]